MEESVRRARLRDLDDLLDALEQLNLKDAKTLPQGLLERLRDVGVSATDKSNVTELIEQIWDLQEQFLGPAVQGPETPGATPWRGPRQI